MSRNKRTCYEVPEQGIALIPVGKTAWAIIDLEDIAMVKDRTWFLHSDGYAATNYLLRRDGRRGTLYMHRLLGHHTEECPQVDHQHFDRLDNRKSKLRPVTHGQNLQNRAGANTNNRSTGVRGVYPENPGKPNTKYYFWLQVNRKKVRHGGFITIAEADAAVRAARGRLMTHSKECVP